MRRSAAPSQAGNTAKRPKFVPPSNSCSATGPKQIHQQPLSKPFSNAASAHCDSLLSNSSFHGADRLGRTSSDVVDKLNIGQSRPVSEVRYDKENDFPFRIPISIPNTLSESSSNCEFKSNGDTDSDTFHLFKK